MQELMSSILDNLFKIIVEVPKAIIKDLLFPPKKLSREEWLSSQAKKLGMQVQRQQDRITYQAGVIMDQSREISGRDEHLKNKDQEIKQLKNDIWSLELQLQEKASRSKR
jgi:hypothetical protein